MMNPPSFPVVKDPAALSFTSHKGKRVANRPRTRIRSLSSTLIDFVNLNFSKGGFENWKKALATLPRRWLFHLNINSLSGQLILPLLL
jgi:hypothetical protein